MSKKLIISSVALTLVFIICFAACSQPTYTDPSTGKKFILVTDENGKKMYSDDGELLVYATDKNGKIVTDDDGKKVTEIKGFVGQIEKNGTVDDYAYSLELPSGWKTTDEKGVFENKTAGGKLEISIVKYKYKDFYNLNKEAYDNLVKAEVTATGDEAFEVSWDDDFSYKGANSASPLFELKYKEVYTATLFFENNGNMYKIRYECKNNDEAIAEFETFIAAISYKQYVYYDDVTDVETSETVKAASTTATD